LGRERLSELFGSASDFGRGVIKSKADKDKEEIDRLAGSFGTEPPLLTEESAKNLLRFKSAMESTIDARFAEIMKGKAPEDRFLSYVDSQILTASVRNIFRNAIGSAPPQIEAACLLSEAILAPSTAEREQLIKTAVGVGGGAAGVAMIITAVGTAMGWGAGVIASVAAFFVGTSVAGPVGWAVAGVTLAGIAAYFATTSSSATDTERFVRVLKGANSRAVDAIWAEHEQQLTFGLANAAEK
jgi:hypothetical protein